MSHNHLSSHETGPLANAVPADAPTLSPLPAWAHMKPEIRAAIAAFRRDLPELLTTHAGQWAAYSPTGRIALGESKTELYQASLGHGHARDAFIVFRIEPETSDDVDLPLEV